MRKPLFPLGQCLITPCAKETLESLGMEPAVLLQRHQLDWSELCKHDQVPNREAGGDLRLLSTYRVNPNAIPVLVITEEDRSSTMILLPEEYEFARP